jgi:hypothetical protein
MLPCFTPTDDFAAYVMNIDFAAGVEAMIAADAWYHGGGSR